MIKYKIRNKHRQILETRSLFSNNLYKISAATNIRVPIGRIVYHIRFEIIENLNEKIT